MRVGHQRGGRHRGGIGVVDLAVAIDVDRLAVGADRALDAHDVALPGADAVGVRLDLGQAGGRDHDVEIALVARLGPLVGAIDRHRVGDGAGLHVHAVAVDQLDELGLQALALHVLEAAGFEGLHEHRRRLAVEARLVEHGDQLVLHRQAEVAEEGRVLGLGVDGDGLAGALLGGLHQVQHLLEGGHLVAAVVLLRALGVGGDGAQALDLGQREVLAEPAGLRLAVDLHRALAGREFGAAGDVGAQRQVGVMAGDEHAVLGGDQVHLDHVGAELDGAGIGLQRLLGQVAGGATVRDHQRRLAVEGGNAARAGRGAAAGGEAERAGERSQGGGGAVGGEAD